MSEFRNGGGALGRKEADSGRPSVAGMFSEPWRLAVPIDENGRYFAAAALVIVRDFLAVPELAYWRTFVTYRLKGAPGLIGHSIHADASGRSYCLLTLWRDEASRELFTRNVVRRIVAAELGPQVEDGRFAEWELSGAEAPPTLPEAFRRLSLPPPS